MVTLMLSIFHMRVKLVKNILLVVSHGISLCLGIFHMHVKCLKNILHCFSYASYVSHACERFGQISHAVSTVLMVFFSTCM